MRLTPLLLALLLISCAPTVAGPVGGDEGDSNKIVDGDETAGYENVVWLTSVFEDGSGNCTGTLIHGRVVLTAKHCIQNEYGVRAHRIFVGFGDDIEIDVNAEHQVIGHEAEAVQVIRTPGDWSENGDIAILILDKYFASPAPAAIVRDATPREGEEVTGVGYGSSTTYREGIAGTKLIGKVELAWWDDTTFATTGGNSACAGDSGGPGFVNGRVWGIASHLRVDNHEGDGDIDCGTGAVYVRTDAFLDMINDAIRLGLDIQSGRAPLPILPPPPELEEMDDFVGSGSGMGSGDDMDDDEPEGSGEGMGRDAGVDSMYSVPGAVGEEEIARHDVTVPAGGWVELELLSLSGDADLFAQPGASLPAYEDAEMAPCFSAELPNVADTCALYNDGMEDESWAIGVRGYQDSGRSEYSLLFRVFSP